MRSHSCLHYILRGALILLIFCECILGILVCLPITHPPIETFLLFFIFPTIAAVLIGWALKDDRWKRVCRYSWLIFYFSLLAGYHLLDTDASYGMNLIPFHTISLYYEAAVNQILPFKIIVTVIAFSIIQYLPLTVYVWFFGKWNKRWEVSFLVTICVSIVIEILQWWTKRGICDVDDIFLAMVGSLILVLFLSISKKHITPQISA